MWDDWKGNEETKSEQALHAELRSCSYPWQSSGLGPATQFGGPIQTENGGPPCSKIIKNFKTVTTQH